MVAAGWLILNTSTMMAFFYLWPFILLYLEVAHDGGNISRQKTTRSIWNQTQTLYVTLPYSKKVMMSPDSRWTKGFNFQLGKMLKFTSRGQAQKGKDNYYRNHYR